MTDETEIDPLKGFQNIRQDYVVGFAFRPDQSVILIKKHRPIQMYGLYNGPGGKIENKEDSAFAMSREFFEETGIWIEPHNWFKFHTEVFDTGAKIHFFTTKLTEDQLPTTKTDESVSIHHWKFWSLADYEFHKTLYNLCYLIPMAYSYLKNHTCRYTEQ